MVIYVQRLSSAKRVYGKVLNVVANNDGGAKKNYLITSQKGQVELFKKNLEECKLSPNDIVYVEAHGPGTSVGDDIEIRSLAEVYGKERDGPLLVGSVKTNLGHTDATAGLCSIAKVILMFETGWIPASLNFNQHKKSLDAIIPRIIEPVINNTEYNGGVVAINMFGIGGTNIQILLGIKDLHLFTYILLICFEL